MSALPPLLVAISASGEPAVYMYLASPDGARNESGCRLCGAALRAWERSEQECDQCLRRFQWKAAA
jgi:hypothetical protein